MNLSELVGKNVDVTVVSDEVYTAHTLVGINHALFMTLRNRAGSIVFVAWNLIAEIRYVPPENRRKPRTPKTATGEGAAGGEPGDKSKVH